jgi:hypothetical protein
MSGFFRKPEPEMIYSVRRRVFGNYVHDGLVYFEKAVAKGKSAFSRILSCQPTIYLLLEVFIKLMNGLVIFQGEGNVLL